MSMTLDALDRIQRGTPVFALNTEGYEPTRVAPGSSVGTQPATWDARRAVTEGLQVCSTLATVVHRISTRAASVPWRWWSDGGVDAANRRRPDVPGELVPWIEYPTRDSSPRWDSRSDIIAEAHVDRMIVGEGYIGQVWGGVRPTPYRKPIELRVESPDGVSPVIDQQDRLTAWEWSSESTGGYRHWRPEDIIQLKWMKNPASRWRGLSPLQTLGLEVDTFVEILRLQLNRAAHGAAPGMVVKDTNLGKGDIRLHQLVEDSLNARAQRTFGGFMVIGGEQELVPRQMFDARQLQFLELAGSIRDSIWAAYGLHPALGSTDASTLDNMGVAHAELWKAAALMNQAFATQFTMRWVPPEKRQRMWIAPDYREVPELARTSEKVQDLKTLIMECRRSPADAIRFLRLPMPTTPEDEVPLVKSTQIPVGLAVTGEGS